MNSKYTRLTDLVALKTSLSRMTQLILDTIPPNHSLVILADSLASFRASSNHMF